MTKPNNKRKSEHIQETPSKKALNESSNASVISFKDMKKQDLIKHCESLQSLNEKLKKENENLKMHIDENNAAVENLHMKITRIENNQKD